MPDDANRLTSVNGVTYIWDANGNLLSDGIKTYTYDSANRLKAVSGQQLAISYGYNRMGDRLQEILNGQTTTFAMDYNTGLTQALNDGTNNYIYGNGRIAQVNTSTEYFLGDALGSVRQLTNDSGAVTYASAYGPYGVTTQSYGASQTAYGYTNEYMSQGLVYLRARYYAPNTGRFLTKDVWDGTLTLPITYNKWVYANSNPLYYTDASGNFPILLIILLLSLGIGIFGSGCSANASTTPTAITAVAYPSDCRNITDWYVGKLTDLALSVGRDPVSFINTVAPGEGADWRVSLRRTLGNTIIFCWSKVNCGFYDVSTPGNIAYGYLGAQVGISRQNLHDMASLGQIQEDVFRQLGVSHLPPGTDGRRINGFDTPGDFQAIELGYDLWEQYGAWIKKDQFMQTLNRYHSVLEIGTPDVEYSSIDLKKKN